MMKKKMIIVAIAILTISTGAFAQAHQTDSKLSVEQKAQMKEVKEKYAAGINDLRNKLHIVSTEQKVLLSSKTIDEKAIYANIDKMGLLKADMHKQTLAMRSEIINICPAACKGHHGGKAGEHKGNKRGAKMGCNKASTDGKESHITPKFHQGDRLAKNDTKGEHKCQGACTSKGEKGKGSKLNLNIEQTEKIAEIKKAHFWEIQETENQIALAKAKNTGAKDQAKAVAQISALQTQLAKRRMAVKLETMKVLTEEQRMHMIAMHQGKSKNKVHGMRKQQHARM